jgi:RNA polymerase sigma-70 factor (ECF subfamily)
MQTTPFTLLERLRKQSAPEDWKRFTALYAPLLYHWARRIGLQAHDAADLVQEVFVVLVQKLPEFSYDRQKSFRAWLRTVTLNKWREQLRRHTGDLQLTADFEGVAAADTTEAYWETDFRQELAARALRLMQADFEPSTWKACHECVVAGRPAVEVAKELGLTPGAVRVAKFRVLTRLRQELGGMLE